MRVCFLLGPAGSGKTYRCLAEIRAALKSDPTGPPLLLLTPKQATYQWERQLLSDADLAGFTRLHILSFERLAEWVRRQCHRPPAPLLTEGGRVMVLRALLAQKAPQLRRFTLSARLPGLAQEMSALIAEIQLQRCSPARLRSLATEREEASRLRAKLEDLALILEAYQDWTVTHRLSDASQQMEQMTELLLNAPPDAAPLFRMGQIWVDGFSEFTVQELDLLAGLASRCDRITIAFCLDRQPEGEEVSWLSTWSAMAQTFRKCRRRLSGLPDAVIDVEVLARHDLNGRYAEAPALAYLEKNWSGDLNGEPPLGSPAAERVKAGLRVVSCPDPQAEAVAAAREVLRHVRSGGRYRECAAMVRQFDGYHEALSRVFGRYGIPFFLDRRESISHHPLADLARYALRTLAFNWQPADWLGLLKTGLMPASDEEIDQLENLALANGWQGAMWQQPLVATTNPAVPNVTEPLRRRLMAPLNQLACWLRKESETLISGALLAESLREFWRLLKIESTLDRWQQSVLSNPSAAAGFFPHASVWEQVNAWLNDVELAFREYGLTLAEWLPVLEAGLAGLTVGSIPPALDQVLIGAVDRSRNPDLRLMVVLGVNESVFPAAPRGGGLLTDAERSWLEARQLVLVPDKRAQMSLESFLGYIAFTRARQRLAVTFSRRDATGRALNPSLFLDRLRRLFPELGEESPAADRDWWQCEHRGELAAVLLRQQVQQSDPRLLAFCQADPHLASILNQGHQVRAALRCQSLSPRLAENLYGLQLDTAVSRLEAFAACPFKFLAHSGLRAQERELFEIDPRGQGSFQHAILQRFHDDLLQEGQRWRDLTVAEARDRIARTGEILLSQYGGGLFEASEINRFDGRTLIRRLQRLISVLIEWTRQYRFDPRAAEFSFGLKDSTTPGWRRAVDERHQLYLRGKVDRIDLFPLGPGGESALAVVMDYKLSGRKMEPVKLRHGLEIQLLAYLAALCEIPEAARQLGFQRLLPAGVFYVNLRGDFSGSTTRAEALRDMEKARRDAFRHRGRFNVDSLPYFDNRRLKRGDQFHYWITNNGSPAKNSDAVTPETFQALLTEVKSGLVGVARRIYAGDAAASPYRLGSTDTACHYCLYRSICRFDPWVDPYRVLSPPASASTTERPNGQSPS